MFKFAFKSLLFMEKIKISKLVFALFITVFIACESTPEQREILTPKIEKKASLDEINILAENAITVNMRIEGMTCAMGCANKIETEVASLRGVGYSHVDFETEIATFIFDRNEMTSRELVSFIGEINNGAYQAEITKEVKGKTEAREGEIEVDSIGSLRATLKEEGMKNVVHKGIPTVNFPNLFTYFLKSLR